MIWNHKGYEQQYNQTLETSPKIQNGLLSDVKKFQDYVSEALNMLPQHQESPA